MCTHAEYAHTHSHTCSLAYIAESGVAAVARHRYFRIVPYFIILFSLSPHSLSLSLSVQINISTKRREENASGREHGSNSIRACIYDVIARFTTAANTTHNNSGAIMILFCSPLSVCVFVSFFYIFFSSFIFRYRKQQRARIHIFRVFYSKALAAYNLWCVMLMNAKYVYTSRYCYYLIFVCEWWLRFSTQ